MLFTLLRRHLLQLAEEIAHGYAWVGLVPAWRAGVLLALMTFLQPEIGAIGFLAAICAWYAGNIAGADGVERPICVFNGLLIGLFIGHMWIFGWSVAALAILAGVFTGWLTVVLGRLSWSLTGLPILSMPFAVVAMLVMAAGGSLTALQLQFYIAPPALFGLQIDQFLRAFGNLYFLPNPLIGLFVVAILLLFSRYYLILAVIGYSASSFWLGILGAAPEHLGTTAWDSNAILAALLVGGLFATASWKTAALAALAAVISAWLSLALGRIVDAVNLVPFSMPFVLAAWIVLYAVVRNTRLANYFNLQLPDFPERTYERTQLTRARIGEPGSVALAVPFSGEWTISQGVSGEYTHRGEWRYALDFIITKEGSSYAANGGRLEDFYCYQQPVLSPAYGQVWWVVNDVADNLPGTVNVAANWGNHLLIRLYDGRFVMLAHFKPGTIAVEAGAWLQPGDFLGYCGNSGRSPQPHIHMHLQTSADSSAVTVPFHLASVLVARGEQLPQFELAITPVQHDRVAAAVVGDARPFYLLAGRGVRYTVAMNEQLSADWSIHCEVDDLGRLVLVSSRGGRALAESTWATFSCYQRHGKRDDYFDIWLLGCGYTPASFQSERWQDKATPARLLPGRIARYLALLFWPWATFLSSSYQRSWDGQEQAWCQTAHHRQHLFGFKIDIEAIIQPQLGCRLLRADMAGNHYTMQATSTFQRADLGVPGWEVPLQQATTLTELRSS